MPGVPYFMIEHRGEQSGQLERTQDQTTDRTTSFIVNNNNTYLYIFFEITQHIETRIIHRSYIIFFMNLLKIHSRFHIL